MAKKPTKTRRVKTPKYASFRPSKPIKHTKTDLSNVFQLTEQAFAMWRPRKKLFFGLVAVYMMLTVVVVGSIGVGGDINALKEEIQASADGPVGALETSFGVFESLIVSGSGAATEAGSVYQLVLIVLFSLASIFAIRQIQAGKQVGIKQSFYNGMYPLVPFLLVLFVLILQLLPLLIGNYLYSLVVNGGVAVEAGEQAIWALLAGLLTLLSLYLLSSSLFALYIVTLPDVQPRQALRSARELVRYRRFLVMRKVLALPLLLVIMLAVVVVPLIIFAAPIAEIVFFVLSMAILLISHSYLYILYRELL